MNKVSKQVNQDTINRITDKIDLMIKHHKGYTDEIVNIFFSVALAGSLYIPSFVQIYATLRSKIDPNTVITNTSDKIVPFCKTLKYIDPEEEYELFCNITKQKDHFRYVTLFSSTLLLHEKDPFHSVYIHLVQSLVNTLKENIDEKNNRECCDEIIEHLKILITQSNVDYIEANAGLDINAFSEWEDYLVDIQHLKTYNVNDCESLSLRASFMINDICNCINF